MSALKERLPVCLALYRKELRAYFDTPAAYVITVVLLLISGYFFATPLFLQNQAALTGFVNISPLLFLFFVPALTMRLYSEELKSGTIELLATLPVKDAEVLLAKYAASLTVLGFMLAGTFCYPLTLGLLGEPDWGGIAGSYCGLALTAAVFAAAGIWASSLTRNQIVAFILSFLINFVLFILGKLHEFVPEVLSPMTDYLGIDVHLNRISRGLFDSRELLYYASLTGYFLYLAYLNVKIRRLRG